MAHNCSFKLHIHFPSLLHNILSPDGLLKSGRDQICTKHFNIPSVGGAKSVALVLISDSISVKCICKHFTCCLSEMDWWSQALGIRGESNAHKYFHAQEKGGGIVAFPVNSYMHRGKSLYKYHRWLSTQNWPGQWMKVLRNNMIFANKRAVKEWERGKAGGLDKEENLFSLGRFECEGEHSQREWVHCPNLHAQALSSWQGC